MVTPLIKYSLLCSLLGNKIKCMVLQVLCVSSHALTHKTWKVNYYTRDSATVWYLYIYILINLQTENGGQTQSEYQKVDEKRETVDQRWGHAKTQRWTYQKTDGTERGLADVAVCMCLFVRVGVFMLQLSLSRAATQRPT